MTTTPTKETETMTDRITSTQADRDAVAGNLRVARRAFIMEEVRQTGCLMSEAADRFDAGER